MTDSMQTLGRPSLYTPELVDELIEWIASGQTLRAFSRQPGKPAWRTIYDWIAADSDLSARIARAREIGGDAIAEETLAIADTPLEGVTITTDAKGAKEIRGDMLGHRKLQVETRLKLLAKWFPQKYGDKIEQTHKGDPKAPVALTLIGSDIHG